jgi:ATP-dependent RNA helicase RhlE
VKVEVARSGTTAERAEQQVFHPGQHEKLPLLLTLLEDDELSTLVFTRTKRRADKVAKVVQRAGHKVARIHADRSQAQRRMALEGFKDGTYRVLVATDIAARGIDVAEIGHVVNFDLPHVPEDYVHRVGRTARMAASGRASSFASPEEMPLLRDIEGLTRKALPKVEVPRDRETFQGELKRIGEAQANPGADAQPAGFNRNRRRAAAHNARRGTTSGTGGARASSGGGRASHGGSGSGAGGGSAGGGSGSSAKPKVVGSWGGKRRR